MGKPGIKLVLGAVAGFIVFMLMEPSAPSNPLSSTAPIWESYFLLALGAIVGLVLGGYSGYLRGSKMHAALGAFLGALFGLVGVSIGGQIGSGLISHLGGGGALLTAPLIARIFLRILALAPIGLFLGLGIGASSLNWRRAVQGGIGGLIGGVIGAAAFDPIADALAPITLAMKHAAAGQPAETGTVSRALYCLLLGAGVGLFVGLVENLAKSAWLRLNVGRNEGKEWPVDAPVTVIGRGEMCNVPLFGDPAIAPRHASILKQGDQYILRDENSPSGTYLNGQRITQSPLFHGVTIQVGSYALQFLMKTGQTPVHAGEMLRGQQHFAMAPQASGPSGAAPLYPSVPAAAAAMPMPQAAMPNVGSAPSVPTQVMSPQTLQVPAPPVQAGGATLVALNGPLSGQRFPIGTQLEIGREAPGVTLSFDGGASRRHASLMSTPGGVIVTDLGSTNGTFVNDQPVQAATLSPGDTIRIGATSFKLEA